jgi:L-arabinose transport system ATP-binding protein
MAQRRELVGFEGVGKSFGPVAALEDISFGVPAGSVRALLGENGAGKSTLLKVLSGAHRPTRGALRIDGERRVFQRPAEALAAGVAVIYQELQLVPELSVEDNLLLGRWPARLGVIDRRRQRELALDELRRLEIDVDPAAPLGRLPLAQRQMVEIAKQLSRGARVIAFDEPTSSLSAREVERLFRVIRELAERGCAVLYVTHRMDEVFRVCDSATVFRDGRLVRTFDTLAGVDPADLVRAMVGRDIADVFGYRPRALGAPVLEVRALTGPGLAAPCSFDVVAGEVVGMFGLVGAGRTELLRLLFGARRASGGEVRVDGRGVALRSPRDAIVAGIALCPEDRRKEGIVPIRSVLENLNLSARRTSARFGLVIDERWERDNAAARMRELDVRAASPRQPVRDLSGGNQQKVVLGRWLSERLRVLLLDEPTRGVDVGAKSEIYRIVQDLAGRGLAVLLVSSDLPEVLGVSDRVLVMRQGRIAGAFARGEASEERVLQLALPQPTHEVRSA